MARSNNGGQGPGNGLWQAAEMGNSFNGQNNRTLSNTVTTRPNIPVHENMSGVFRYPTQPTSSFHYTPGWGETEDSSMAQKLWNSEAGQGNDQSRSFLGTEQWGRESGGAPWGSGNPALQNLANPSTTESGSLLDWMGISGSKQESPESSQKQSQSPKEEVEKKEESQDTVSSNTSLSRDNSPTEEVVTEPPTAPPEQADQQETVSKESPDPTVATAEPKEDPESPTSEPLVPPVSNPPVDVSNSLPTPTENVTADTSLGAGTIEQLQQLSLENYVAQQQIAQLTNYQIAVQQQYALAQQQHLSPGMFLPNSYIIPAQNNAQTGYTDPNAASQLSMMTPPYYGGWPASAGMYPNMLQQQFAAAAAASVQQSTSPSTSQPNRGMAQTPLSRSNTPSSQPPDAPSSDILSNFAAMQQNQFNQAMALASYPMIPSAYYDQTGALIINNGRSGGPVRLFAPGPMIMNGSQPMMPQGTNGSMLRYNQAQQQANAMLANQASGGSTPIPSGNPPYNPPPGGGFGSGANIGNLGIGNLGAGIGSQSSTPQRRDSFSEYHPSKPHYGGLSLYGASPGGMEGQSPRPLGGMMSHPNLNSPSPSMPSPTNNLFLGGSGNRMFSAAPGGDSKYRQNSYMASSIFGSSGSSLFPPTRIRPPNNKDILMSPGRSKLLDDFRNNRLPNPQLHELTGHIVEFSQDQHGSRFIQQKLERATNQEKQLVFTEIIGSAYQLMTDVFGNYVIQKFFEFGCKEHKLALANCIHGHVLPLALQMYGCRVIQKALECIPQEQQVEIVTELDGHLLKCVKDQNGNHVVQKCIECIPSSNLQFIVDGFKGQVVGLCSHPYGCRVMQRILEQCTEEQTAPILEELHQHTEMLVKDQFGNYVIQHILEHGRPEHKSLIVNELRGKLLNLSQHKFASNVIEKCVSHSSHQNRLWLIEEVCQEPDALFIMMKDQYANYVVQKMLDVAEPQQKKILMHKIRPHFLALRKFTYGKHIITKLEKFYMKTGNPIPPASLATDLTSSSQVATANWVLDNSG